MSESYENAVKSITRMQQFDVSSLVRREELGTLNFQDAVQPAKKLIELYQRITLSTLEDLPDSMLQPITNVANADFSTFEAILKFSMDTNNPKANRDSFVERVRASYQTTFTTLWQYIAYGVSKATDVQLLESEARGVIQGIKDKASEITDDLDKAREDAGGILAEVRRVAAEQGVSQQALYFHDEAQMHKEEAGSWQRWVYGTAIAVGVFALLTIIAAYIPALEPHSSFQAIQLVAGKVMVFATLAYLLGVCVKNFQAHRHNEIINRHRENALKTFKALADGSRNPDNKDIVLTHASQCIFSAQDTGYTKAAANESGSSVKSVIELLPKALGKAE